MPSSGIMPRSFTAQRPHSTAATCSSPSIGEPSRRFPRTVFDTERPHTFKGVTGRADRHSGNYHSNRLSLSADPSGLTAWQLRSATNGLGINPAAPQSERGFDAVSKKLPKKTHSSVLISLRLTTRAKPLPDRCRDLRFDVVQPDNRGCKSDG